MNNRIIVIFHLLVHVAVVEYAVIVYLHLGAQLKPPAPEGSEWLLRLGLYIIAPGLVWLFIWATSSRSGGR